MRYDAAHKEQTRKRVLTEASRALRGAGPDRLGVAEVMARAGLTHGGFYAHFRSKEELLAQATEAAFVDARRMFEAAVEGKEPRAALAAYLAAYLSPRHRELRDRGCPLPAMAGDLSRMSDDARGRYAAGVRRLTERLHRLMEAAGVEDPQLQAPSVLAELVGALSLARAMPDPLEAERLLDASHRAVACRLGLGEWA